MYQKDFPVRLARLRNKKGISARDMSLSLGQNPGYINNIENGKALPSMTNFFYICDYLHITPGDFFDDDADNPEKINLLIRQLKTLDDKQLDAVMGIVNCLDDIKQDR